MKVADLMYKKECHRLSKLSAELQKNVRETERGTDMAMLIVAFHNFANVPGKDSVLKTAVNEEYFETNSAVDSSNTRNKHHLHR